jgi:hypothetical protein
MSTKWNAAVGIFRTKHGCETHFALAELLSPARSMQPMEDPCDFGIRGWLSTMTVQILG